MKYLNQFLIMVLAMLWVAGWVYLFGWQHWHGVGCFFAALPGVVVFLAHGSVIKG